MKGKAELPNKLSHQRPHCEQSSLYCRKGRKKTQRKKKRTEGQTKKIPSE